jgi:hypothetical protein
VRPASPNPQARFPEAGPNPGPKPVAVIWRKGRASPAFAAADIHVILPFAHPPPPHFLRSSSCVGPLRFFLAAKARSSFSFELLVFFVTFPACLSPVCFLCTVFFAMPHAPCRKQGEEASTYTVLNGARGWPHAPGVFSAAWAVRRCPRPRPGS